MSAPAYSQRRRAAAMQMPLAELMAALAPHATECGDCLLWHGPTSNAKGARGTPKWADCSVRRLIWTAQHGSVPPKRLVTTSCGTPQCIAHLALTTKSQVTRKSYQRADVRVRKAAANRAAAKAYAWTVLDDDKAAYIRASTEPLAVLAAELGCSKSLVSKVRTGRAWAVTRVDGRIGAPVFNPFLGLGAR